MTGDELGTSPVRDAGLFTRGLFDPRLQLSLTRGMLATIQRGAIVLAVLPSLAGTVLAFKYLPLAWAIVCLIVFAPLVYVVVLAGIRIALGFGVALLDFLEQLTRLPVAVDALSAEVLELRGEVSKLRGGVDQLREEVAPLSPVVTRLNGEVDHLKASIDSVQFWRAPSKWRRGLQGGPVDEDSTPNS